MMTNRRKLTTFGMLSATALSTFALSEALSHVQAAELTETTTPATVVASEDASDTVDSTAVPGTAADEASVQPVPAAETDADVPTAPADDEATYAMNVSLGTRVFEAGKSQQKNSEGVFGYRIPAMIQTVDGTLIASGDQRVNHSADWGDINIVARRSEDGGKTWEDPQAIIDLPTNPDSAHKGITDSAYNIDSALIQDPETKRIFALYDMMPEIQGIWDIDPSTAAYTEVDGEFYLNLYKTGEKVPYTVREKGVVYTPAGEMTDYRVITEAEAPAHTLGDLYQNDEKIGNVYFRTNTKSPFQIAPINYIWLSYSDDDGKTWSGPRDITPQIREDWMKFFGVGPGASTVLHTGAHKGRLIVPMYTTNRTAKDHLNGSQSSLVIYSDDHGETWHRGEAANDGRILANGTVLSAETMDNKASENSEATVVQLNNGDLKMFMRNRTGHVAMATSKDGGETWEDTIETLDDIPEVYVQLDALQTMIDGKEYLIIANASGPGRTNGTVHLAEVNADGTFNWVMHQKIQGGKYAYNSIAPISEGKYGILFEHSGNNENDFNLDLRTIEITTPYHNTHAEDNSHEDETEGGDSVVTPPTDENANDDTQDDESDDTDTDENASDDSDTENDESETPAPEEDVEAPDDEDDEAATPDGDDNAATDDLDTDTDSLDTDKDVAGHRGQLSTDSVQDDTVNQGNTGAVLPAGTSQGTTARLDSQRLPGGHAVAFAQVKASTMTSNEPKAKAVTTTELPQTAGATVGLGLSLALISVGSTFAFKKRR